MEFNDINNLDVHVEPYESQIYVISPYLIKNSIILLYDKDKLKNTELGKYIDSKIKRICFDMCKNMFFIF